ncbi:hypothetical protein GCM10018987_56290 [Streptomyces cremeus]
MALPVVHQLLLSCLYRNESVHEPYARHVEPARLSRRVGWLTGSSDLAESPEHGEPLTTRRSEDRGGVAGGEGSIRSGMADGIVEPCRGFGRPVAEMRRGSRCI